MACFLIVLNFDFYIHRDILGWLMTGLESLPFLVLYATVAPFLVTYLVTSRLIGFLHSKKMTAIDFHKPERNLVATPGGLALIAGLVAAESLLFLFTREIGILAILLTTVIASVIGFVDDFHKLGGLAKPALLLTAAIPILALSTYSPHLVFPFFGSTRLTFIYPILILIAIPVTANTINTIDVLNGAVSGFVAIATVPLVLALFLNGKVILALAAIPLIMVCLAFFLFHRFPSRIFPGDSGTLALGAIYGAIAIVGGVEIVAVIAILPAILNSFFFLTSVKGFVEHSKIKVRPTIVLDDGRLMAEKSRKAPVTLVRLIASDGPLGETEIVRIIFALTAFSAFLATLLALLT